MRILFFGTGDFAVPSLRALHQAGHVIAAVISQPDRPSGRGRGLQPTPVRAAAEMLSLPHLQTADVNALDAAELGTRAEIGVVVDFGQKIGSALLAAVPRGFVNIHASLLPKYRGAAPVQWAILNGEQVTGVTVFQLDERWDAGPIWAQRSTPIDPVETADELHSRLAELGAQLIVETLPAIVAGTLQPLRQDHGIATRAPKLTKADGRLTFDASAETVVRRIHGLWSWPGAACTFISRSGKRERLLLARAAVADHHAAPDPQWPPGAFHPDRTLQTGRGRVRLLEVQPAGKKLMPFDAFANGRHIAPPDRLLPIDEE